MLADAAEDKSKAGRKINNSDFISENSSYCIWILNMFFFLSIKYYFLNEFYISRHIHIYYIYIFAFCISSVDVKYLSFEVSENYNVCLHSIAAKIFHIQITTSLQARDSQAKLLLLSKKNFYKVSYFFEKTS